MNKVIMIFLDAFSSRYINANKTPFLYEIAQKGFYAPIKPMFAFQGIGASMFSGTVPNKNKIWCDWVLKTENIDSLPIILNFLLKLSDLFPNDRISKDFRYVFYKMYNRDFGTPNLIPSNMLSHFELKLKKRYTEENSLGQIITLFDQLKKYNMRCYISGIDDNPGEERIIKDFLNAFKTKYDLYLIKLSSLDSLGHKYGPDSPEIYTKLREIDGIMEKIITEVNNSGDNVHSVIFSDHGMSTVIKSIDFLQILNKLPIKMDKDYILFLDSTVSRFWFNNGKAKKLIYETLSKLDCGQILNKYDLEILGIDKVGPEYGELFFALKEGWVFHPDFFRRYNSPKGMHGYAYPNDGPILIIHSQEGNISFKNRGHAQMIDIMPTVLDLLNIPVPNGCEGVSCIRKNE